MAESTSSREQWVHELVGEAPGVEDLARRLVGDGHAAADVAQDAMLVALEKRPGYGGSRLRAWLAGIVKVLAKRQRVDASIRGVHEGRRARRGLAVDEAADQVGARLALHARLAQAVDGLAEPYRSALTRRFFEGLSPREIARRTGKPSELVRKHVSRGLEQLRERLDAEDLRQVEGPTWRQQVFVAIPGLSAGSLSATVATIGAWLMAGSNKVVAAAAIVVIAATAGFLAWRSDAAAGPEGVEPAPVAASDAEAERGVAEAPVAAAAPDPESAASERKLVDSSLRVLVHNEAGAPLAEARVWVWGDEATPVHSADADGSGTVELPALTGQHHFTVAAPGYVAQSLRFAPVGEGEVGSAEVSALAAQVEAGVVRLTLAPGRRLFGRVSVDGAPPTEALRFQVRPDKREGRVELPAAVDKELGHLGQPVVSTRPTVDAGSTVFEVAGLPVGWSGRLDLPRGYWFSIDCDEGPLNGATTLLLAEPREDLVLGLTKLPTVRGRLLWSDDLSPVTDATLTAYFRFEGVTSSPFSLHGVNEEGRFRIGAYPMSHDEQVEWRDPRRRPAIASFETRIKAHGAVGQLRRTWTAADGPVGEDLGDILIERARSLHVLVLDAVTGEPVPGARVHDDDTVTDDDGRVLLAGERGATDAVMVGAVDYAVTALRPVRGTGVEAQPLVFELPRGNAITFELPPVDKRPARLRFFLMSEEELFFAIEADDGWTPHEVHRAVTPSSPESSSWGKDGGKLSYGVRDTEEFVVAAVRPGVAMTAQLLDMFGDPYVSVDVPGLGVTEQRRVKIGSEMVVHPLQGIVEDAQGSPVANALLRVERKGGEVDAGRSKDDRTSIRTDGDGRFRLTFAEKRGPISATVLHPAHGALERGGLEEWFGRDGLRFVLPNRHLVRVHLLDEAGAAVPDLQVHCSIDGLQSVREDNGVHDFDGLPPGPVEFWCRVGTRRISVQHRGDQAVCELRVPPLRELELVLAADRVPAEAEYVRVVLHDDGGQTQPWLRQAKAGADWAKQVVLPQGRYDVRCESRARGAGLWTPITGTKRALEISADSAARIEF